MHSLSGLSHWSDFLILHIANTIDIYVVVLSILTFVYFIYKSIEHRSEKRFIFLIKELVRILISVGASWCLSFFIKHLTAIPRPFIQYESELHILLRYGSYDSFPSGHATLFMALGMMMSLHHRRVGYVFIFLGILISLARVIIGIHFPIDILAGWCIGAGVSLFVYKKIRSRLFKINI